MTRFSSVDFAKACLQQRLVDPLQCLTIRDPRSGYGNFQRLALGISKLLQGQMNGFFDDDLRNYETEFYLYDIINVSRMQSENLVVLDKILADFGSVGLKI
jgi:hypothetical protein